MREPKRRRIAAGFSLLETMVALIVLAVGILGLAALLYDSLSYMQGSQDDFIAQQKAEEFLQRSTATTLRLRKFRITAPEIRAGYLLLAPYR